MIITESRRRGQPDVQVKLHWQFEVRDIVHEDRDMGCGARGKNYVGSEALPTSIKERGHLGPKYCVNLPQMW